MLIKDPNKRPSIRKILEKDFLSARISQLLSNTIAKHEFSSTFLKKHVQIEGEEDPRASKMKKREEIKEVDERDSKRLRIKREGSRRRTEEDDEDDMSVGREKTPVPTKSNPSSKAKEYFKGKSKRGSRREETKEEEEEEGNCDEEEDMRTF
jgi:NIMA (never in mitosis gene a)-related kinase